VPGRIGWASFSRSGLTVFYRGGRCSVLEAAGLPEITSMWTREEYRISGIKKNGQDAHWASRIKVEVDEAST
jgi:hypothetical protein